MLNMPRLKGRVLFYTKILGNHLIKRENYTCATDKFALICNLLLTKMVARCPKSGTGFLVFMFMSFDDEV